MNQPKVSVIYHGAAGALQVLAKDVAAGAEEEGAVVRVRRVPDHAVPGAGESGRPRHGRRRVLGRRGRGDGMNATEPAVRPLHIQCEEKEMVLHQVIRSGHIDVTMLDPVHGRHHRREQATHIQRTTLAGSWSNAMRETTCLTTNPRSPRGAA